MDKETLPRWGWLVVGLFVALMLAEIVNAVVLVPVGLPEEYRVITVITAMAPVIIYLRIWYEEENAHYWERSREWIAGDVFFVVLGAIVGSTIALLVTVDTALPRIASDLIAMGGGFLLGWVLFWWRNPEVYQR
ncbi:hypothetical protein [Natrialbaceae archaeon AArc-T1-2]|uniref:hypothetical protein n=1 Tax=Natrialbaceae archaeon AArc-T1-2 TaxID=3053904 RepID=UPI00255A9087|nr:hypothetical protein [Natrialbaceae archaeon AArc-T1-2]WIV65752.1 hypothetical protein QQ977_08535 [Natrialbaceae archaeon AArc-T1-2]